MDAYHTRKSDHRSASPQDIHRSGVAIAKWGVQADISQLAPSHVLLFGSYVRKDDPAGREAKGGGCGL